MSFKATFKERVKAFVPHKIYLRYAIFRLFLKKKVSIMRCHRLKSGTNEKPQYIVTLTSHGNRLKETAPYAIATLLNQSVMPDPDYSLVSARN